MNQTRVIYNSLADGGGVNVIIFDGRDDTHSYSWDYWTAHAEHVILETDNREWEGPGSRAEIEDYEAGWDDV